MWIITEIFERIKLFSAFIVLAFIGLFFPRFIVTVIAKTIHDLDQEHAARVLIKLRKLQEQRS